MVSLLCFCHTHITTFQLNCHARWDVWEKTNLILFFCSASATATSLVLQPERPRRFDTATIGLERLTARIPEGKNSKNHQQPFKRKGREEHTSSGCRTSPRCFCRTWNLISVVYMDNLVDRRPPWKSCQRIHGMRYNLCSKVVLVVVSFWWDVSTHPEDGCRGFHSQILWFAACTM